VEVIAHFMTEKLGASRSVLAVVLAGAIVTYGGVSLFVAIFVLVPMAQGLFRAAQVPLRLMPAAIALGTMTFTMSALPGTPALQNAIPMPFFGTTPFAAPGLGIIAATIMLTFGLWWLGRAEHQARGVGEGYSADARPETPVDDSLDTSFLAEERWGATSLSAVGGVWAVVVALVAAILTLVTLNFRRLISLRASVDAGANASVLPALSVASLVGFGAVIAALPAFALVRDWVLSIQGGPLVSLAVATNVLAALTGSASGGLTIALDALAETYLRLAAEHGIEPALLHRVAVMSAGTLDSLPHNGAVVTLLAVCGVSHRDGYLDIFMVAIVGALVALVAVILLGSALGSF
jgi:H+/gluconate symporter-like permease